MRSAEYFVREHRKTEVDAEIRRSSQVEESAGGSWGHPLWEIDERFAQWTTDKSVIFYTPQLPITDG